MSPTGRLPAVEAGSSLMGPGPCSNPHSAEEQVAAASAVLDRLRHDIKDLDRSLRGPARGEAVAFRALLEGSLVPALVYSAWCEQAAYADFMQPLLGRNLPFPLSYIMPATKRHAVQRTFAGKTQQQVGLCLGGGNGRSVESLGADVGATRLRNFFLDCTEILT